MICVGHQDLELLKASLPLAFLSLAYSPLDAITPIALKSQPLTTALTAAINAKLESR